MKAKFSNVYEHPDEDVLACPLCNGDYLHQVRTEIFERSEDEVITQRTTVRGSGVAVESVKSHKSGNPSLRRHGLRILFECEVCSSENPKSKMFLSIFQHKGNTWIGWEVKD